MSKQIDPLKTIDLLIQIVKALLRIVMYKYAYCCLYNIYNINKDFSYLGPQCFPSLCQLLKINVSSDYVDNAGSTIDIDPMV